MLALYLEGIEDWIWREQKKKQQCAEGINNKTGMWKGNGKPEYYRNRESNLSF